MKWLALILIKDAADAIIKKITTNDGTIKIVRPF